MDWVFRQCSILTCVNPKCCVTCCMNSCDMLGIVWFYCVILHIVYQLLSANVVWPNCVVLCETNICQTKVPNFSTSRCTCFVNRLFKKTHKYFHGKWKRPVSYWLCHQCQLTNSNIVAVVQFNIYSYFFACPLLPLAFWQAVSLLII